MDKEKIEVFRFWRHCVPFQVKDSLRILKTGLSARYLLKEWTCTYISLRRGKELIIFCDLEIFKSQAVLKYLSFSAP